MRTRKVECAVDSCLYHRGGACGAKRLTVGGGSAREARFTFCGSYCSLEDCGMLRQIRNILKEPDGSFSSFSGGADGSVFSAQIACTAQRCLYRHHGCCAAGKILMRNGNTHFPTFCGTFTVM